MLVAHRRSTLRLADRIVRGRRRPGRRRGHPRGAARRRRRCTARCSPGPATTLEADPIARRRRRPRSIASTASRRRPGRTSADGRRADGEPAAVRRRRRSAARRRRAAAGGGGWGMALAATPELLAGVDALPPADDDARGRRRPRQAAPTRASASRRFLRPLPAAARHRLRASSSLDTLLTLLGPLLVRRGIDQGVAPAIDRRRCGCVARRSSASRSSTGSVTWGYTRSPGAPPSGCSSRCASASSPTSSGCRSTTTTARWRAGS